MDKRKINEISSNSALKKVKVHSRLRPAAPNLNAAVDKLIFQELDLDHYIGYAHSELSAPQTGAVPIMRMFGVTKDGNSVCCHVHGFSPYFYVNLPDNFMESETAAFKNKLNAAVLADMRPGKSDQIPAAILMIEIVQGISFAEYNGKTEEQFAKITVGLPQYVVVAKRLLTTKVVYEPTKAHSFFAFESDVDIETRFMIDTHILGCCWIELPATKWFKRTTRSQLAITSQCQIEIDVSWKDFIAHDPEGKWATVAPFRILSFDVECAGRKNVFPEANVDPVIQIANVVKLFGTEDVGGRIVFTLKSCAPIDYAEVRCFDTEEQMLDAWGDFVREVDPDIFTGFNINHFDFPYLLNRAKHLKLSRFGNLCRIQNLKPILSRTKLGRYTYNTTNIQGRVSYDMFLIIKRDFILNGYSLNAVSRHILGEEKEDVHFSIITDLQHGNDQTRRRLAVYCLKDAELPVRLLDKALSLTKDIEMTRVAGITLKSLLFKGDEVKVIAQLLRYTRDAGYFMPSNNKAAVADPGRGICKNITAKLDFRYPTIMLTHNLCYTTLLKGNMKEILNLTDDQVTVTPVSCSFVKPSVRRGILPDIIQDILSARMKTNKLLRAEMDPVMKSILNGRQLAYQTSAHLIYELIDAHLGKLPCLEIARSLEAYRRLMID